MRESKMIDVDSIVKGLEELVYQDLISIYGKKIASNCSEAMLNCLWLNFRKVYLYVPTSDGREIQARNMAIWKEFNGKNHAYLAVKHRLSVQRIYAIIKIMRAEFSDNENSQAKNRPLLLWVIDEYMTADFIQCGLSTENAKATAQRVADHLCENFPGVSIRITDYIKASREAAFMLALP